MKNFQKARVPLLFAVIWVVALGLPGGPASEVTADDPGPVVRTIYLADPAAGLVHRVEAKFARKPKLRNLEPITDIASPAALAVHPGGEFLLVIDSSRGQVVKFDLERNKVVRRTKIGGDLVDIEFAPDGRHAFVADRSGEAVHVYDAKRGSVMRSIEVRGEPVRLAVTDKGTAVYTANAGTNMISRIDGQRAVASATRLRRDAALVDNLSRRGSCTVNGGIDTLRMAGDGAFNYVMWTCGTGLETRRANRGETDFEEQTALACDSGDHTGSSGDDCASTDFDSEGSTSEDSVSEDSTSEDSNSEDSTSEDSDSEDSASEDSDSEDSTSDDSSSEESTSEDSTSDDSDSAEDSSDSDERLADSPPIPTVIPGRPAGHVATDLRRALSFTRRGVCQADRMVVSFRPEADSDPTAARTFLWDFQGRAKEIAPGVALDAVFGGAGDELYVNGPCQGKCRPNQVARRTRTLQLAGAIAISDGAMLPLPTGSCEAE